MTEINLINEEIIQTQKEDIDYLKKLQKKLKEAKSFLSVLTPEDEKLFKLKMESLVKDTDSELTSVEYENLTTMMIFCDKFEKFFYNEDPSKIDVDLFNVYRMAKEAITEALRDYRKESKRAPQSIDAIKSAIIEIQKDDGTIIKKKYEKKVPIIQDIEIIEIIEEKE